VGRGGAAAVVQPGLLKWLKQSGVDDVTLANISWAKLVQPDKKGDVMPDEVMPAFLQQHSFLRTSRVQQPRSAHCSTCFKVCTRYSRGVEQGSASALCDNN